MTDAAARLESGAATALGRPLTDRGSAASRPWYGPRCSIGRIGPSVTGTLSQTSNRRRSVFDRAAASAAVIVGLTTVRPVQPTSIAGASSSPSVAR